MKIFLKYLKYNAKNILCFAVCCVIFATIFYLFSLPLKAVLYPALLCLFFIIICAAVGFIRFYKKHKMLERLTKEASVTIELLPKESNLIEEDYQNVIRELFEFQKQFEQKSDIKYSDLREYFTLWAHQIKTPIAAMSLILQSDFENPQSRELLEELQKNRAIC